MARRPGSKAAELNDFSNKSFMSNHIKSENPGASKSSPLKSAKVKGETANLCTPDSYAHRNP